MKITTPIRALLVMLSLVMVFSLFACGEEVTTLTDAQGTDTPTEAPEETGGATEAPTSEATEGNTNEATDGETTDGETTATETDAPECEHEAKVVAGKAATCTEAGLTDGEVCSKCDAVLKEQTAIPALGHDEEVLAAVAPTCTATGLTAGKQCKVCETITVPQTEVAATGHAWDAGTPVTDAVCGQTADITYTCTAEGCDENYTDTGAVVEHVWNETSKTPATCVATGTATYECTRANCPDNTKTETLEIDENAHDWNEEGTQTKAPTCTEEGVMSFTCKHNAEHTKEAPIAIDPEAHDWNEEGTQTKNPTCTEEGAMTYTCKHNADHTKDDPIAIDPDAHKWVDVPTKKPAPHEDGYEAYKDCEYCDKIANTDGTVIDSIVTIPGLDCEVYFDAEKIYNTHFSQHGSVNKTLAEDGSYIRYDCKADFGDGYMELINNNDKVTGKYLVFKYRTDITAMAAGSSGVNIWANTFANDHDGGNAYTVINHIADSQWHVTVVDLSAKISKYVKPAEDDTYTIMWARLDFIDKATAGGFFELAFIMLCDDLNDVAFALNDEDKAACTHQYVSADESCHGTCCFCKADMGTQHDVKEFCVDDETTRTYTKACVNCGGEVKYSYTVEFGEAKPNVFINANTIYEKGGVVACNKALSQDGSYVTFTDQSGAAEGYWNVYGGDGSVTGQYLLMKYRTNDATGEMYVGANNGFTGAQGGDEFYFSPVTDGQWQIVVIDLSKSASFKANDDNTYSASYIRWDIFNGTGTGSRTIDVAYVAIADDLNKLLAIDGVDAYMSYMAVDGNKRGIKAPMSAKTGTLHFDASSLNERSSQATIMNDSANGNMPFVRYNALGDGGEDRFVLWTSNSDGRSVKNTGRYIVYMYRKSPTATADFADIFLSCNKTGANGSGDNISLLTYINDGKWHAVIVDLSVLMHKAECEAGTYASYYDPEEGITSLTFDWLNQDNASTEAYIDVAFVAFCDTSDEAAAYVQSYYDKYLTEACNHGITAKNYYLAGDDNADTYTATKADTCLICNGEAIQGAVKVKYNMDSVKGDGDSKSGVREQYDAAANGLTADSNGIITGSGWAGSEFAFSKVAYRVLDANGNVLTNWTEGASANISTEDGVRKAITEVGCDPDTACRFTITVNVSEYFATNEKITVEYALIVDGAPEGSNDNIVYMFAIKNLGPCATATAE